MRLGDGGFTLIEAMLVVVLLAILAAAVLISNPIERVRLNGAAEKVKSDIRYARKLAVSTQQRAGIEFAANGYSVYAVATSALANGTGEECTTNAAGKFVVDFSAPRCRELNGITLSGFTNAVVAFDSLGTPVDASGTPHGINTVIVSGSAGTKTITIQSQTGRVSE